MIVFTGADKLKISDEAIDDVIDQMEGSVQNLLEDCEHRYVAFDNTVGPLSQENTDQVNQLLAMAEEIAENNEGRHFSDDLFKKVANIMDKKLKDHETQIKELKEKLEEARRKLEDSTNATEVEKAELRKEMADLKGEIREQNQEIKDLQNNLQKKTDEEEDSQSIIQGKKIYKEKCIEKEASSFKEIIFCKTVKTKEN